MVLIDLKYPLSAPQFGVSTVIAVPSLLACFTAGCDAMNPTRFSAAQ